MLSTLIQKIQDTLNKVSELAYTYDFTASEYEGYPCAVFLHEEFNNRYLTDCENLKGYTFKIVILAEQTVKGAQSAYKDVLLPAVDAVVKQFDEDWDQGTSIEGHRIWSVIESGRFDFDETQDGTLLFTELFLTINVITNI